MPKIAQLRRATFFTVPGAQVAVYRASELGQVQAHRHEFIEIAIVLSGQAIHVTEGVRHRVQAGDVLVINSSRSHAYEESRSLKVVNVLIREEIFRGTEKKLGRLPGYHALFTLEPVRWRERKFNSRLRLKAEDLKLAVSWIDALEEETRQNSEEGQLLAQSWVILLIGLLARLYGQVQADAPRLQMRLARVLSRIEQAACEKSTVRELARSAAMSERTFLRRFREATGYSPVDYVIRVRIRQARELLATRESGLSITDVAFRCGFQDSNYFSRQFRRLVGTSPRAYRIRA